MKTMFHSSLVAALLAIIASSARADEKSHRKAAEELLKTLGVEKLLQSSIDQVLDLQIKSNPQIAPYRDVMKQFFSKHMSWDSLKTEMIGIYVDALTEDELKQITTFFQTPAGKKMVEKQPELMSKGMQIGMKRVQDNQAELQRMMEDAARKK